MSTAIPGGGRLPRAYAAERLTLSGQERGIRERHLRWAQTTTARIEQRLEANAPWRTEFDLVADNLRAALGDVPAGPGRDG